MKNQELINSPKIEELRQEAQRQLDYYSQPQHENSSIIQRIVVKRWLEITEGGNISFDKLAQFARFTFYNKYVGSMLFMSFCCQIKGLYLELWKQDFYEKHQTEIKII